MSGTVASQSIGFPASYPSGAIPVVTATTTSNVMYSFAPGFNSNEQVSTSGFTASLYSFDGATYGAIPYNWVSVGPASGNLPVGNCVALGASESLCWGSGGLNFGNTPVSFTAGAEVSFGASFTNTPSIAGSSTMNTSYTFAPGMNSHSSAVSFGFTPYLGSPSGATTGVSGYNWIAVGSTDPSQTPPQNAELAFNAPSPYQFPSACGPSTQTITVTNLQNSSDDLVITSATTSGTGFSLSRKWVYGFRCSPIAWR